MAIQAPDPMDFYVYVLFRSDGRPFYVGKGRGRRWMHHEWYARTGKRLTPCTSMVKKMLGQGVKEIPKVKVAEHLTAAQAIEYEKAWIVALGISY
jgi:hypothetical protein